MASWPLRGLHLMERNQLIFIIALGESILLLGGTLLGTSLGTSYLITGGIGFLILVSIWALYFVELAERAENVFDHAEDPTALARASLTGTFRAWNAVAMAALALSGVALLTPHGSPGNA